MKIAALGLGRMRREKPQHFFGAKASRRICKREALDRRKNRAHGRQSLAN
jgi:hypothetical protein